ncbi:MAG: nucleotidyl transferase AbiEii/AbiGii toxin family protein [Patescibacteria group bacterium]|nr:nucleotidyl transferase AbiEii/AbiGii toxin family protein [Patescibacteria group bacterium]
MFYNILDKKRLEIIPLLNFFKSDFYLAGGTGLALQLGHRDSVDFDYFSSQDIDTKKLFTTVKEVFKGHKIIKVQEEKNTLTVFIDNNIKLSFFTYKYKLLEKLINEPYFKIASIIDIACMKLAAIVSRATNKDYIDLYFILKEKSLRDILGKLNRKIPELDINLVLKSLVYFEDINKEKIKFKNNKNIDWQTIEVFLKKEIKNI